MARVLLKASAALAAVLAVPAEAAVRTEANTRVQVGGALGGILKLFGGKAAKEGVVTRTVLVGDRRLLAGDENGQIVDLTEEAIYELDLKKKTYTVVTFAELKKRFDEERAKAEKEAQKAQAKASKPDPNQPAEPAAKEFDVDFQASPTAEKRDIAGHPAKLVILRATVHEKGVPVQKGGGVMFRSDLWLAPKIAELAELDAWNLRYAAKMAEVLGAPAGGGGAAVEQMAKLYAMYPGAAKAMERMRAEMEKVNLEGTAVATIFTVTAIRSAEQLAAAEKESMNANTGITGFLAKKAFQKASGDPTDPRQMLLSASNELIKVGTDATAADVSMPAGFKQK